MKQIFGRPILYKTAEESDLEGHRRESQIETEDTDGDVFFGPEEAWVTAQQELERCKGVPGHRQHIVIRGKLVRRLNWA